MASKIRSLSSFLVLFLLFLLLPLLSYATLSDSQNIGKSLSIEFLKNLKGCQKGDIVKGIRDLKDYLERFGYYNHPTKPNNDEFDELLESAIKTYQRNYHLKATGILDVKTISKMKMPRCGMPDIINGTNWMHSGGSNKKGRHGRHLIGSFHVVSHYEFLPGEPRWPDSKRHLTYRFLEGFPDAYISPVEEAFKTWARNSNFTFTIFRKSRHRWPKVSDLKISFEESEHGDGYPFNDRVLAHSFGPSDGRLHFNKEQQWSVVATPSTFHLRSVALHEIGHLLGLAHTSLEDAIMYPSFRAGQSKDLTEDDIDGINNLYA
ncbi:metalloendoproteinase 3-MMP-like [Carya illinoinensis]|uniref:Peptidase metallopeptidase domain-containing protein n=1 Tax=Carya illinoinensis TaxID=32201 RepID=A0A8T1RRB4_CARIL|nr:metalloendoproteinase 3-MMP-like [Carya illinoinensis]KAG6668592.1 hypothetical protein CIPAW_01G181600 [Carya illinoinensis]